MELKQILVQIEQRQDELFSLLSSLIQINSENFRDYGNEQAIAEHIHALCLELGLESECYSPLDLENFTDHPDYRPGRHLENRLNVTARWKGLEDRDDLMLMAHNDTVAIGDRENWDFDPLSGEIRDGKIWGRGACDDKYALATCLFLIKLLQDNGFTPRKNLIFSAYCDEERGGSHGALAAVLKTPCPHIVSMDGRQDQIWHCGSGGGEIIYTYHAAETVDNAKGPALALPVIIAHLDGFAKNREEELEKNPFYTGTIIPKTALRYMDVHIGNHGADLGIGKIRCVFYTDKTKEEIEKELSVLDQEIRAALLPFGMIGDGFTSNTRFFHYVHCQPDSPDVLAMVEASKAATGKLPLVCGSCLSDLSVISKYGSSNAYGYGCGRDFSLPGGAHQPNEYIECDALLEYTKTMAAFILKMLG